VPPCNDLPEANYKPNDGRLDLTQPYRIATTWISGTRITPIERECFQSVSIQIEFFARFRRSVVRSTQFAKRVSYLIGVKPSILGRRQAARRPAGRDEDVGRPAARLAFFICNLHDLAVAAIDRRATSRWRRRHSRPEDIATGSSPRNNPP
jgi:hypothetical protein